MSLSSKIFVVGHRGLVGSGILRKLAADGYSNLLTRSRAELDLTDAGAVFRLFEQDPPEFVFLCAAKVGGILANVFDFETSHVLPALHEAPAPYAANSCTATTWLMRPYF